MQRYLQTQIGVTSKRFAEEKMHFNCKCRPSAKFIYLTLMTTEIGRRYTNKLESDRHIKVESCQPGQKSANEKDGK